MGGNSTWNLEDFVRFTGLTPIAYFQSFMKTPPIVARIRGVLTSGWWSRIRGKPVFVSEESLRRRIINFIEKRRGEPLKSFAGKAKSTIRFKPKGKPDPSVVPTFRPKEPLRERAERKVAGHVAKTYFKGLLGKRKGYIIVPAIVPVASRVKSEKSPTGKS